MLALEVGASVFQVEEATAGVVVVGAVLPV